MTEWGQWGGERHCQGTFLEGPVTSLQINADHRLWRAGRPPGRRPHIFKELHFFLTPFIPSFLSTPQLLHGISYIAGSVLCIEDAHFQLSGNPQTGL